MCVSSGSRICFICLLLYSWHSDAKEPDHTIPDQYDPLPISENSSESYDVISDKHIMQKDYFLSKLINTYGNGVEISFEGFEHLLHRLGLGGMIEFDHHDGCHKTENSSKFLEIHDPNHNHSVGSAQSTSSVKLCVSSESNNQSSKHELVDDRHKSNEHTKHTGDIHQVVDEPATAIGDTDGDEHNETNAKHKHDQHLSKRSSTDDECLSVNVMLRLVQSDTPRSVTREMFKELCPSLIYQIDSDSCHTAHTAHAQDSDGSAVHDHFFSDHEHHSHEHGSHAESVRINLIMVPSKVWGYSAIAVTVISLVGLLGVAVIPIMQKVFYNHMLQFLVALAVGALSGDALLHLLPHAISGGHGDVADDDVHDNGPIYKGLCGLMGIYFFFFIERVLTMFTEMKRRKKQLKNRKKYMKDEPVADQLAQTECDGMMMSIHPNKALRAYVDEAHSEHCTISFENTTNISHEHGQRQKSEQETCADASEKDAMIDIDQSTPKANGHGHSHGGIDGVPGSVSSVAWMVILGDGIHNFSDGLAIGAAFVNSITGGFSTSVAVFCHELPHEIGDFAMLLRAGMSAKQAIIYNCLSSVLCFIGMLIGVAIGNLEGSSLWIFAIVGGMFLYIALVDMLPELSSVETKKGEHPMCHLLLQGLGMFIGAGIMLVIALYEEDLKNLLD